MPDTTDIPTLRRILHDSRRIAVVGISAEWHRPSFFVGKYLLEHGYTMIPVNPKYRELLGQVCYPDLAAARAAGAVDMVDCFRKAEDIGPLADQAIAIGAKTLWMQLGVVNNAAADKARAAGLDVVMDRCVKIEHGRLFGGLNWAGVNTRVISARRPRQLPY
jgi:predicted CoA-binding protein